MTEATEASLERAGFDLDAVIYANRDGVGSMSRAFNDAVINCFGGVEEKYIWFVTNVTFGPDLPASLLDALESNPKAAAVHPGMNSSHGFINKAKGIEPASFIEWAAPMIRTEAWEDIGELDEDMPYVHFDLDWSHRAKEKGWGLLIDGRERVSHTYLHIKKTNRISQIRSELRSLKHADSLLALNEKWGPNAISKLCVGGNCG